MSDGHFTGDLHEGGHSKHPRGKELLLLTLGALGIVYGDIGTSPLYAFKECFHSHYGLAPSHGNVLGVLSLILWSLIVVVTIKYLVFIMRADNRGEGGVLALMALVSHSRAERGRGERWLLVALGIFGAALLYGDGIITPAVSVLSAIEGLAVAQPDLAPFVQPITVGILFGLFMVQRKGTGGIGVMFGPITLCWFLVLAILGIRGILLNPGVLAALNPLHAAHFFVENGSHGFLVLGSVFLVVTGGEALYADMGHFGARPIRLAWFYLVFPALLINYFGQGALVLTHPEEAENPFFHLAPDWAIFPLVLLATAATTIASQALISGAFSLTRTAVQLGYCPRVEVRHTSASHIGQIYVPSVNVALMIGCIALVLMFKSSSNLAAAYGIAVTGTMAITTVLFFHVMRDRWEWPLWACLLVSGTFLVVDLAFLGANLLKIHHGGWVPLTLGVLVYTAFTTWKKGRHLLTQRLTEGEFPQDLFLNEMKTHPPVRVPGTAIFMSRNPSGIPNTLLHNLKHNKIVHERVVFLTVRTQEIPSVPEEERASFEVLGHGFFRIVINYGFMEDPNIPAALARLTVPGLSLKPMETTFFLGRETLIASRRPGMALWREELFARMSRNERTATSFFRLPPNRVVELGEQIEL